MAEYIKREELMKFPIRQNHYDKKHGDEHSINGLETVLEYAENLPAADVAPVVHGRWIPIRESEMTGWNPEFAGRDPIGGYKCSECGEFAVFDCNDKYVLSDFCPQCGAEMDGGADNETDTVDEVPVVRCKDCKYWGDEAGVAVRTDGVRFARCKVHNLCVSGKKIGWCPTEDDFCSQGERRGR